MYSNSVLAAWVSRKVWKFTRCQGKRTRSAQRAHAVQRHRGRRHHRLFGEQQSSVVGIPDRSGRAAVWEEGGGSGPWVWLEQSFVSLAGSGLQAEDHRGPPRFVFWMDPLSRSVREGPGRGDLDGSPEAAPMGNDGALTQGRGWGGGERKKGQRAPCVVGICSGDSQKDGRAWEKGGGSCGWWEGGDAPSMAPACRGQLSAATGLQAARATLFPPQLLPRLVSVTACLGAANVDTTLSPQLWEGPSEAEMATCLPIKLIPALGHPDLSAPPGRQTVTRRSEGRRGPRRVGVPAGPPLSLNRDLRSMCCVLAPTWAQQGMKEPHRRKRERLVTAAGLRFM